MELIEAGILHDPQQALETDKKNNDFHKSFLDASLHSKYGGK